MLNTLSHEDQETRNGILNSKITDLLAIFLYYHWNDERRCAVHSQL